MKRRVWNLNILKRWNKPILVTDCMFRYIEEEMLCIKYDYANTNSIN